MNRTVSGEETATIPENESQSVKTFAGAPKGGCELLIGGEPSLVNSLGWDLKGGEPGTRNRSGINVSH